jgi:hypothetical protein
MDNDHDIYRAPAADLGWDEVPEETLGSGLTSRKLVYAGWLSILIALLSLPLLVTSFLGAVEVDSTYVLIAEALTVVTSVIWVYLVFVLKHLLNKRFAIQKSRLADLCVNRALHNHDCAVILDG